MNPKTVLITGANRGIGLEFVKQILKLQEPPLQIYAACRSPEKNSGEWLCTLNKYYHNYHTLR